MIQKLQAIFTHKHTYLAMLVAVLIAGFGEAWFIKYYRLPHGPSIRILGGVIAIPHQYWLDMPTVEAGISFKDFQRDPGGRILIGKKKELKPDFWSWTKKDNKKETERCGVTVSEMQTDGVNSVLLYDAQDYVLFVQVPDLEIEKSIDGLCDFRSRFSKQAASSNSLVEQDAVKPPVTLGVE